MSSIQLKSARLCFNTKKNNLGRRRFEFSPKSRKRKQVVLQSVLPPLSASSDLPVQNLNDQIQNLDSLLANLNVKIAEQQGKFRKNFDRKVIVILELNVYRYVMFTSCGRFYGFEYRCRTPRIYL